MINEFLKFAEKATGKTADELKAEIMDGDKLKDGAIDILTGHVVSKIENIESTWKEKVTAAHDKGYQAAQGKGLKEYSQKVFDELKEKGISLEGDVLSDAIFNHVQTVTKGKPGEITEDIIKKHPLYVKTIQQYEKEYVPKADFEKVQTEFNEFKGNIEKKQKHSTVFNKAFQILEQKNVNWGADEKSITRKKDIFKRELLANYSDFAIDGDNINPLDQNGELMRDSAKNLMSFESAIMNVADGFLSFNQSSNKGGAGGSGGAGGGGSFDFVVPKNDADYTKMIEPLLASGDPESIKKAKQIKDAYAASKAK